MNAKQKKYIKIVITILILIINHNTEIKDLYKNSQLITNPDDILVLVNKQYRLPINHIPDNLALINNNYAYENKYLVEIAKINFEKLCNDAKKKGYNIIGISAYRDYQYQKELYTYYVKEKGKLYADKSSARPGHSEHQTGLAIDVMGSNLDYNLFDESPEFNWMKNNAHKYGFILRYPEGKEHITGFKYEPWHYRYVGKKVAKDIYKKNFTLETYLEKLKTK